MVRWFVLAPASCRIRLFVLVQVDLHEEGHNGSRDRCEVDFTEACLAISFVKSGARFACARNFKGEPSHSSLRIDRWHQGKRMRKKKPRAAGAGRGKASSQGGENVARPTAIQHGNHGTSTRRIFCSRMLLRVPRASLADPAGGGFSPPADAGSGQAALAFATWVAIASISGGDRQS